MAKTCWWSARRKAATTKEKVLRNFGSPNPEGYRKSIRAMKFAEKFGRPVITFVDVTGAYPGIGAEERGQAEAIALESAGDGATASSGRLRQLRAKAAAAERWRSRSRIA